jgi:Lipid A 3-O-deacylase (PagL)
MSRRNLPLFAVMLACLTLPAPSLGKDSKSQPSNEILQKSKPPDFNRDIYYKNKLEYSSETGWLPINIPFVFDVFLGDAYTETPLKYTLVPNLASVRWQMDDIGGPGILRGNWEMTFSGAFTAIPRGPETRYLAYIMGIRRNFIHRNWRIVPYFDGHLGLGNIDAKEPKGVPFAQGQDFTFTMMMGSGVRYNFNARFAISAGLNWMHISNLYLSEPKFPNYGINVYGPMVGFYIRLGKPKGESEQ